MAYTLVTVMRNRIIKYVQKYQTQKQLRIHETNMLRTKQNSIRVTVSVLAQIRLYF